MNVTAELLREEDARCAELNAELARLDRGAMERAGYTEVWSVKDLLGHLGCWCAEAARALERIRLGTYERRNLDIDAMNEEFYACWKDGDLNTVHAEFWSGRNRMLEEWGRLEEPNRLAQRWFAESGPKHYEEHLPRLREWVAELAGS